MSALNSLQSLSSVAVWPVLMMNWRSIVAYFPAVERFINDLNVDVLIQMVLGTWLGLSGLSLLLSLALAHSAYSTYKTVRDLALATFHTKCSISESSGMYSQVVRWITRNPKLRSVNTGRVIGRYEEVEIPDDEENIDIARMMREIAPGIQPDFDKISFWHRGSYFWLRERKDKKLEYHGKEVPDNYVEIFCFSLNRKTEPLKQLLSDIIKEDAGLDCEKTVIFAPDRQVILGSWRRTRTRLRRPLSTVILDQQQKDTIATDVRNFLTQSGVSWYREKGLPHRLGYLFHGPPGTGKSSLAFALASHFGLSLYMMNLSSPGLSDDDVENLFAGLPRHCIVLLEDVDATQPLSRALPRSGDAGQVSPESSDSDDEEDDAPTLRHSGRHGNNGKGVGSKKKLKRGNIVTLSGLLNAIDGVAASEGRILIQTTNHIEKLDEALIRTGRADRIITFTNTTKQQAEDMFINAYTGTKWGQHMSPEVRARYPEMEDWTDEDIDELAKDFSDKIHAMKFSPALIQQFFKDFRAEPRRAVQELDEWMKDPRGYRRPSLDYNWNGSVSTPNGKTDKDH